MRGWQRKASEDTDSRSGGRALKATLLGFLALMFVRSLFGETGGLILPFSNEAASRLLRARSWRPQAMRTLDIGVEVDLSPDVREKIRGFRRVSTARRGPE